VDKFWVLNVIDLATQIRNTTLKRERERALSL